jgi:hypothetical protein
MADIPEDDLEETRAALAPTIEATAAILPWVAKPKALRFDAKLNERWIEAGKRLAQTWSERHRTGSDDIRPAIFNVYSIAIETADSDCLRLGEALASAADRLEEKTPGSRLIAALSGAIDCLNEPGGLEHEAFGERARHFAGRLEATANARENADRSKILDHLFVNEAREAIESMHDALAALPPDAYALTTESIKLAQQAELLEIWGVMHLARQIAETVARNAADLDSMDCRRELEELLRTLTEAIATVDA